MAELGVSYRLVTPLGTLEFNDYASASYYRLTQVSGMDCGTIRPHVVDRPQRDGALVSNAYEGALYPMFRGQLVAGSSLSTRRSMEDNMRSRLKALLRADGTLSWLPSGSAVRRQRTVRLHEKFDIPGEPGQVIKAFLFALVAGDPLAYSETEQMATTSAIGAGGGLGPGPLWWFFAAGQGGLSNISPGGTAPTWPRIRIYGPGTGITIRNETTGRQISLPSLTITAGQFFEINMRAETIALNADPAWPLLRYLDASSSSFWSLEPVVTNTVKLSILSGWGAGTTRAEIFWRDAWDG